MSLLHVSINAEEPERVARFLGHVLGGRVLPFPPSPDSWIAFSKADDGTAVEVYPTTHVLIPGPDQIAFEVRERRIDETFAHIALCTPLDREEVLLLAEAESWLVRVCNRGPFECIEVWIENRLLVEVLDPSMQRDYRHGMTGGNWASMFAFS